VGLTGMGDVMACFDGTWAISWCVSIERGQLHWPLSQVALARLRIIIVSWFHGFMGCCLLKYLQRYGKCKGQGGSS
jgi:hypothetical protein